MLAAALETDHRHASESERRDELHIAETHRRDELHVEELERREVLHEHETADPALVPSARTSSSTRLISLMLSPPATAAASSGCASSLCQRTHRRLTFDIAERSNS